ncbi:MAG: hypothetical protein KJZ69_12335 [Phycisphaerales bacterium]|nr:hypothetical protein [Phycisphaerales bacterium]
MTHYYGGDHLDRIRPDDEWLPASIFFQGVQFVLLGHSTLSMARCLPTETPEVKTIPWTKVNVVTLDWLNMTGGWSYGEWSRWRLVEGTLHWNESLRILRVTLFNSRNPQERDQFKIRFSNQTAWLSGDCWEDPFEESELGLHWADHAAILDWEDEGTCRLYISIEWD